MNVYNLDIPNMESALESALVPDLFSSVEKINTGNNMYDYNLYEGEKLRLKIATNKNYDYWWFDMTWFYDGEADVKIRSSYYIYQTSSNLYSTKSGAVFSLFTTQTGRQRCPIIIGKVSEKLCLIAPATWDNSNNYFKLEPANTGTSVVTPMQYFDSNANYTRYISCNNVDKNTDCTVIFPYSILGNVVDGIYIPFCRQFTTVEESYMMVNLNGKNYFYTNIAVLEDE